MKKTALVILLCGSCVGAFAQSPVTAPSFPQLPNFSQTPALPVAPNASGSSGLPSNLTNPTGTRANPGTGAAPSATMLTQSSTPTPADKTSSSQTYTPVARPTPNVELYNQVSLNAADQIWAKKTLNYSKSLYSENKPVAPAAFYSDSNRVLYPWISLLRRTGHPESKIKLELSRLTPDAFMAYSLRVTEHR